MLIIIQRQGLDGTLSERYYVLDIEWKDFEAAAVAVNGW